MCVVGSTISLYFESHANYKMNCETLVCGGCTCKIGTRKYIALCRLILIVVQQLEEK